MTSRKADKKLERMIRHEIRQASAGRSDLPGLWEVDLGVAAAAVAARITAEFSERTEQAEAESKHRGDLLNAVVELIEHREQRYTDSGGTTIRAVPVADLRRAVGMEE